MRRVAAFALFVTIGAALAAVSATAAIAQPVEVESLDPKRTDVEVFMRVRATERQIEGVERTIRSSQAVRRFAHLDKRDAMDEFKRIFKRNQKLVHSVRASDLPESFRLQLRSEKDADRLVQRIQRMPGVESAETPGHPPTEAELISVIRVCQLHQDVDFEVFMDVQATQAEFDATREAIIAEPGLTITDELSKDDAYEEFRQIFHSNRDLLQSVDRDDLPMSFRVRSTTTPSPELLERLEAAPGVESAESPSAVCDQIRELLDEGLTPEQMARAMIQLAGAQT